MPQVNVSINGRTYLLACDEGEEAHLHELSAVLDGRVQQIGTSVGQVGDPRLLVMAGLIMCDEVSAAHAKIAERDTEIARLKAELAGAEDRLAEVVDSAASRIESIAARLAAA